MRWKKRGREKETETERERGESWGTLNRKRGRKEGREEV